MIVKGIVFTALVTSTPFAWLAVQGPDAKVAPAPSVTTRAAELEAQRAADLSHARAELAAARGELQQLRGQLERALDALDRSVEPQQREHNCSPSRSRALLSHYQWLRDQQHPARAAATLTKVVAQFGDEPRRIEAAARDLMTSKEMAGKCDDVALALAQRLQQGADKPSNEALDTMALAYFLNGQFDRAVELQKASHGSNESDSSRRRLRTYEAARDAVGKTLVRGTEPTLLASKEE